MRIVYIAAGAGGMYCGTCLHDNTLAAALLELGDEVLLVPTYTPLRTDETDVSEPMIRFGGINVYLQQKLALFRHTPQWLDVLLDRPALLRWVSRRASAVDPQRLGGLTVSMLRGEEGNQRKELEKLVAWLGDEVRPDIVHLSNAILSGMAPAIHAQLGIPVVCSLSGEDIFLDKLPPPYYEQTRAQIRDNSRAVARFVALNRYYAQAMAGYLHIDADVIEVIPHGLLLSGHANAPRPAPEQPTIGFLARICPDKGVHLLVEACERLAAEAGVPELRLRVAGYLAKGDTDYLRGLQRRVEGGPLAGRFEYLGELDRQQKIAFLQSLTVFSLPTIYRESKGISALEAAANGVPCVLPAHGSFPELIHDTGGGLLCEPGDAVDLAAKLRQLLQDPTAAAVLGQQGQRAVHTRFHARGMAEATRQLYERLLNHASPGSAAS